MRPYYEQDGVTLFHGDCREVLPTLSGISAVLTDPPYRFQSQGGGFYGTWDGNGHRPRAYLGELAALNCVDFVPGELLALLPACAAVICCNKDLLADYLLWARERQWLFDVHVLWKSNPIPAKQSHYLHDLEYVVVLRPARSFFAPAAPFDDYRKVFRAYNDGDKRHPAEKPLGLMGKYVRTLTAPGEMVCDPYAGSGTTLEAAKNEGRRAIGIEIEERYCEIAAQRLSQGVLDFGGVA